MTKKIYYYFKTNPVWSSFVIFIFLVFLYALYFNLTNSCFFNLQHEETCTFLHQNSRKTEKILFIFYTIRYQIIYMFLVWLFHITFIFFWFKKQKKQISLGLFVLFKVIFFLVLAFLWVDIASMLNDFSLILIISEKDQSLDSLIFKSFWKSKILDTSIRSEASYQQFYYLYLLVQVFFILFVTGLFLFKLPHLTFNNSKIIINFWVERYLFLVFIFVLFLFVTFLCYFCLQYCGDSVQISPFLKIKKNIVYLDWIWVLSRFFLPLLISFFLIYKKELTAL